ncbi:hydantoinase/oxoprolinase family protein [Prosthecodimorpha staleyi]|uniref:Hydantoinase/oxoprolinase family protein n=1 Tax=Prosthecodimorpha staleyi TaxID=2840188 RepID=A0A947D6D6_9HYPH|nr:hydantoinase/oxoprolinase family protein [Prosthecodimorpha staleyi]MBT9291736.1 hydantoinase/oxoprolinase family protein [Prosthecodimorpha staleyi]
MALVIGIDTGGTFTDAVVYETGRETVVATGKALTTRGDLAVGVGEALGRVLAAAAGGAAAAQSVDMVSVSTTLATNALVEGQGDPVAVLLAGFDAGMIARAGFAAALPGAPVLAIAGGHDHAGEERAPLDLAAAEAFLTAHADRVAAFAVASLYSVRNPAHELALAAMVQRLTGRPATLSGELSADLDAPRRALTAALNARLIGRITGLILAIRRAMADLGIVAPLMIVKGDGTLASADAILHRPIETILSGPAASVVGARRQAGLADFVMSDIGGTTTDIAVLEGGRPRLDRAGAEVGGFRTLVRAVEMRTYGLGGDSEVDCPDGGGLVIGPRRVIPISLLAARHPACLDRLATALGAGEAGGQPWRWVVRPFGTAERSTGAAAARAGSAAALPEREAALLARIGDEPCPIATVAPDPRARRVLDRLVVGGHLQAAGFTPSDAAHITGLQALWSREAALTAARLILATRRMGASDEAAAVTFAGDVLAGLARASARAILETVARRPAGAADEWFDAAADGRRQWRGLDFRMAPAVPIVAVGGPAPLIYGEVGRRLGAEIRFVEHGEVANALGAAVGVVRGRAVVEVSLRTGGGWRIHHAGAPVDVDAADRVIPAARALATAEATRLAGTLGAAASDVTITIERVDLPGGLGDAGLVSATLTAEATGAAAGLDAAPGEVPEPASAAVRETAAGAPIATLSDKS